MIIIIIVDNNNDNNDSIELLEFKQDICVGGGCEHDLCQAECVKCLTLS